MMPKSTLSARSEFARVIKNFLTQLPDPNIYPYPSFTHYFTIEGKEVQLYASKRKKMGSLIWNVGILDQ